MQEEFKLISKSKLEEIYHERAELISCLRDMIFMAQYYSNVSMWDEDHKSIFDHTVATIGKALKGDI